jgi:hypothetical protein
MGSKSRKKPFAGHTVHSIVLEIPDKELLAEAGNKRRIGVWAVATSGRRRGLAFDQPSGSSDDSSAVHPVQRRSWQST